MSQKVSKKASVVVNEPSGSRQDWSKVWSYIRFFYQQNEYTQQMIAQLANSNMELKKSLKGGF